jgi:hypothetical protein
MRSEFNKKSQQTTKKAASLARRILFASGAAATYRQSVGFTVLSDEAATNPASDTCKKTSVSPEFI